jgi:hypothetical protein
MQADDLAPRVKPVGRSPRPSLLAATAIIVDNPQIALAISAVCFGLVIGFLAGYAVRAYISRRRFRYRYME